MNEKGLSVGTLLQKDFADYPAVNTSDTRPLMAIQSVAHLVISTCATVAEAKIALHTVQIVNGMYVFWFAIFLSTCRPRS